MGEQKLHNPHSSSEPHPPHLPCSGGLRNRDSAAPLLRLFHIAMACGETQNGTPTVSAKDLSLLLECVIKTKAAPLLQALLTSNALTVRSLKLAPVLKLSCHLKCI